jgi:hypothetical protein
VILTGRWNLPIDCWPDGKNRNRLGTENAVQLADKSGIKTWAWPPQGQPEPRLFAYLSRLRRAQ